VPLLCCRRETHVIDFRDLNQRLDPVAVLELLRIDCYQLRWGKWRGRCPVHPNSGRRTRSLKVDLVLHRCYCHNCRWTGDLIDLAAVVWGVPLVGAADRLRRHFGIITQQRRGTVN